MSRDLRRQHYWNLHDFSVGRGLEIGPLDRPIVHRSEADVRYVDVHDRDGLVAHYGPDPGVPVEDIPEVDYALVQADGTVLSLADAAKEGAPFAWAIASHVIEHTPDVVGWLQEVGEVVEDGGVLVLAVPDRRFCFDAHRPPTSVGQMLEAHERGDVRPSVRAVYDHFRSAVSHLPGELWTGTAPTYDDRIHEFDVAMRLTSASQAGTYVDCHVWLFTPDSFLEQMHELRVLGRIPWFVEFMFPTPVNDIEFGVRLRRLPRDADPTAPVAGELLADLKQPDWLVGSLRGRQAPATVKRLRRQRARAEKLQRQLKRRKRQNAALRRKLRARDQQLAAMRSSSRWRVGGAVTAPARWLRRLAGRGGGPTKG